MSVFIKLKFFVIFDYFFGGLKCRKRFSSPRFTSLARAANSRGLLKPIVTQYTILRLKLINSWSKLQQYFRVNRTAIYGILGIIIGISGFFLFFLGI